ncbi:endonuclease/exonuclease/phosphatase family protein [Faecalibaculum rodentium]|uniref:endonuclease/exonuclease/phosphatase family protein n=1 Tax=Faecalibaculum rodentium TaxID=1702221 RepID=UPI002628B9E5|nr:endonuclease/exonuclease/phosphatase family protein [Faecalibaculum rodentium]
MKLLTLNTHSLEESGMPEKQAAFAKAVTRFRPDVIALQEVNQHRNAPAVPMPEGYVPAQQAVVLRRDNHGLAVARLLEQEGLHYQWSWLPAKVGYDKYDEGLALFSRKPVLETADLLVSRTDDYFNYRTRRLLGIRTEDGWFFTVHMSWWNDPQEPFARQWETLLDLLPKNGPVYLMGDFNGDAQVSGQTYDLVKASGFCDTYDLAQTKDEGWTVQGVIDGWRDQAPRRIDQIWARHPVTVRSSRVVFNGAEEPVISDHFGILTELQPEEEH